MNIFFVIGLPRTRSAWLANFLSAAGSLCRHELWARCNSLSEYKLKLHKSEPGTHSVGDADPSLSHQAAWLNSEFPEARFLFVVRSERDVVASYAKAFAGLALTLEGAGDISRKIINFYNSVENCRKMLVTFDDLDNPEICREIFRFCVGKEMDYERWELLDGLRVTAIAEKAYATMAPWAKVAASTVSNPMRESNKAFYEVVAQMCGGSATGQQAREWLAQLWALALLWDHLVDNDPVNIAQAELALEAVVTKWPVNAFFLKHGPILAPVLANALAAWRSGGRARHYDVYTEPALAVAFALGGLDWQKQWAGRVHEAAARMRADDNAADNQTDSQGGAAAPPYQTNGPVAEPVELANNKEPVGPLGIPLSASFAGANSPGFGGGNGYNYSE